MLKTNSAPIRVVVIDDSPTVRDLLVSILTAENIQVVGTGANGEDAIRLANRMQPDVMTLDVRMPKMDGLEATRRIMRDNPTRIVIVTGSLMRDDVDLTFEALKAGALTVVSKPGLADPETCDKVVQTVRLMAGVPVIHHWGRVQGATCPAGLGRGDKEPGARNKEQGFSGLQLPTSNLQPPTSNLALIGIAASTGGPAALVAVLGPLPADFPLPILVVQHITQGFASGLAEWLGTQMALRVRLATLGDRPEPGTALLAPDDYHLQINKRGIVELTKAPPYKGLRPSANYLFQSLAQSFGPRALGVILTGMGDDGAEGLDALHRAGGWVIAQDEPSCVVYGMPREAVLRGAVDQALSSEQIAVALKQVGRRDRSGAYEP
jgi:two-component system chemotaxis response regulator CheB